MSAKPNPVQDAMSEIDILLDKGILVAKEGEVLERGPNFDQATDEERDLALGAIG